MMNKKRLKKSKFFSIKSISIMIALFFILINCGGEEDKPAVLWYNPAWEFTQIHQASHYGDVTIDSDGGFHFVYYKVNNSGISSNLIYRRINPDNSTNEWSYTAPYNFVPYPSIALDTNNEPHIAYHTAPNNIVELTLNSNTLEESLIISSITNGYSDVSIDIYNSPEFVFNGYKIIFDNDNNQHLLTPDGQYIILFEYGAFFPTETPSSGLINSFIVDSTNKIHILYLNQGIQYCHVEDYINWQMEKVPDTGINTRQLDIVISPDKKVHIVYIDGPIGSTDDLQNLWHAWKDNGIWQKEKICTEKLNTIANVSILFAPDGKLYVVFLTQSQSENGSSLVITQKK
ncbi:MAG: hypothetical protein KAS64_00050 [Spirochaetes bacterium]|nr:hypothetical protein [Spirochaetota bacterium]